MTRDLPNFDGENGCALPPPRLHGPLPFGIRGWLYSLLRNLSRRLERRDGGG